MKGVSLLDPLHVSLAQTRVSLANARPVDPSALPEAGAAGHRAQSALERDITKLLGPRSDLLLSLRDPRCFQPLRHRWMVAMREARNWPAADRGELRETKHPARPTHAACDRGTSMSSKPVAFLLADLVSQNAQRPHISATIRIRKSVPHHEISAGVPDRFGCIQIAGFFAGFFVVQREHRIRARLLTPAMVPTATALILETPNRSRCRLSRPSRTLRPPGTNHCGPNRGLDQQTAHTNENTH